MRSVNRTVPFLLDDAKFKFHKSRVESNPPFGSGKTYDGTLFRREKSATNCVFLFSMIFRFGSRSEVQGTGQKEI